MVAANHEFSSGQFEINLWHSEALDAADAALTYARALARVVMGGDEVGPELSYGFLLHDVGKVGIPESILCKPGPLTDEQWATPSLCS